MKWTCFLATDRSWPRMGYHLLTRDNNSPQCNRTPLTQPELGPKKCPKAFPSLTLSK